MAVRTILLLGNPILRTKCSKVGFPIDSGTKRTIGDLLDTLHDFRERHGFGRGIAAPQIGKPVRIVVIDVDSAITLINPEITKRSRYRMTLWDDCFSFPEIMVKLKRHTGIRIRYRDEKGKLQELDAEGGLSELLQHEIDHLNGVLAIDRAIDSRHIILRSEWIKLTHSNSSAVQL